MPASSPVAVGKQIALGTPDPIYLIVGDDEAEMSQVVSSISGLVEEGLRAFNLERIYANEKGVTPFTIVQAARLLRNEPIEWQIIGKRSIVSLDLRSHVL